MVVLYNPVACSPDKAPVPLSLLSLGAAPEGVTDWRIVDGNIESDRALLAALREADWLGMTVMAGPQLNHAVPLMKKVRAAFPHLKVAWGGYFPTQHADVVLRSGLVDVVVHSQGEQTLRELVAGDAWGDIDGISFLDDGQLVRTGTRTLVAPGTYGMLPYHRVAMERYVHHDYIATRTAGHTSSFGCPFACSFCSVVAMTNRRWLPEPVELTAAHLQRLQTRYGVNGVQFHDMDFFVSETRVVAIAEELARLGMTWWALGRVDELMRYDRSTWALLKRSGCKMIFCGAETGSDATLAAMNKGGRASVALTEQLAARMFEFGIVPEFSFVVGNPPDPARDTADTFRFIRKLKGIHPALEVILYTYTPVPIDAGGELPELAREQGFRFPDTLDAWVEEPWRSFATRRKPDTPWLDGDLHRQVRSFEKVLNAWYPTVTDRRLTGLRRSLLRTAASWRWHTETYDYPVELGALQRLFRYQRPETQGF